MSGPLTRDDLAALIAAGEDSFTEFKESATTPSDVAKEMCAFANTAEGRILIGVDDDLQIVGDEEWDEERAMNVARTSIDPPVIPTYQRLIWEEGREVAVIGVEEGPEKPYARRMGESRHYYVRVGSTSRQASQEELIRLTQASGAVAADLRPVIGADLEDLDPALLAHRFEDLRSIQYGALGQEDRERTLIAAEILHPETRGPTVAGLLCYGSNPEARMPHATVVCVSYPGPAPSREIVDRADVGGPIDRQVRDAAAFIDRNTARASTVEGITREEAPRPSLETFREIVANAVAHRHYGIAGPIQVRVLSDRVEVVSPGGLPNGVTPAAMRLGVSIRRNEFLVQHLARLGIVDALGRGIALLYEEAASRGLPEPRIHAEQTATEVSVYW